MRTQTIQTMEVTYPDVLVWKNDATIIEITGPSNVGGEVIIYSPEGNNYKLEYYSDQDKLMFFLDDAIKALYRDNISAWTCTVTAFDAGIPLGSLNFAFYVLNGKSFITRQHGMPSTIYVYDREELRKLQVFSPHQGIAICGQTGLNIYYGLNQLNLYNEIRYAGEYTMLIRDSNQTPPLVVVSGADSTSPTEALISFQVSPAAPTNAMYGSDIFDQNKMIFPITHKIIFQDHCDNYNFGEIKYTDLDGMTRYLGGKIISDTDDVKTESYITSNLSIYKTTPNRYVSSRTKTIKLALIDIEKDAYPYDLMNSDSIEFRGMDGEWYSCSLKTQTLTREDKEYYDFEVEIIVNQ